MSLLLILNLAVALAVCFLLYRMQAAHASFTKRVFTGLGLGVLLGAAFQALYGAASPVITETNAYLDIIGTGYVKLLQMIIIPLIMVSIIGAILKLQGRLLARQDQRADHRHPDRHHHDRGRRSAS